MPILCIIAVIVEGVTVCILMKSKKCLILATEIKEIFVYIKLRKISLFFIWFEKKDEIEFVS